MGDGKSMRKPNIFICPDGTWIREENEENGELTAPNSIKIQVKGKVWDIDEIIKLCELCKDHN